MRLFRFLALFLLLSMTVAYGGEADVIKVDVEKTGSNMYRFDVTVLHGDEGWKHYANKWDVVAPGGALLGTRTLYHPHVNEQPFTRSLSGVKISKEIDRVTIRAHDSVHEYGGDAITVELPR
jgi:hypothetical protein